MANVQRALIGANNTKFAALHCKRILYAYCYTDFGKVLEFCTFISVAPSSGTVMELLPIIPIADNDFSQPRTQRWAAIASYCVQLLEENARDIRLKQWKAPAHCNDSISTFRVKRSSRKLRTRCLIIMKLNIKQVTGYRLSPANMLHCMSTFLDEQAHRVRLIIVK